MISSLRTVCKSRSFQSISGSHQWVNCRSFIRNSFKTNSVVDLSVKVIKIPRRFLSSQEITPIKRRKVYNYPDQTQIDAPVNLVFVDNENQMAFKIVDSLLKSQKFKLSKENPVFNAITQDLIDQFLKIDPEHYQNQSYLISDLVKFMRTMSLQQICDILESMVKWPVVNSPFSKQFYATWSNVDKELETRLNRISFSDNNQVLPFLWIGNVFYRLKIANITKFNFLLVRKLSSPDFQLNKTSLLHLMFYINLHRKIDPKSVNYLLKQSEALIKDMSLDEIGVICMTLFKTDTKMSDDLAKGVIFRSLTDISEQTNNIIRCAITKCLRRSANIKIQSQIKQFIDEMKKLSNHSEITLTQLLTLKIMAKVYDPQLITQVFDRLWSDPTAFRVKDIERILSALSNFEYKIDSDKLNYICQQLDEKSDFFLIYHYPMCLLNVLHYLSILGHFPKPLIEHCFELNFLSKIMKYSRLDFQRHLLVTNTALSVEKYDEYKEILLPPEKVYKYFRWILTSEKSGFNDITKRSTLINSVYMTLKSDLKRRVQLCHIFPFRSYPLVVIFDEQNRSFSLNPKTELKANMFDNCIAIYILDIQDFAIVDTMIRGSVRLEIRLLEKMGFKVVTIPWHHLTQFTTSRARRNKVMDKIMDIDPNFQI